MINADDYKNIITRELPEILQYRFKYKIGEDGLFIFNEHWLVFEDVKKDLEEIKQHSCITYFNDISICCYDLQKNFVDQPDIDCSLLEDFCERMQNAYCREFNVDYDKELLDRFIDAQIKLILEADANGENYDDYVECIKEQVNSFSNMLLQEQKLKKEQMLYYSVDGVDEFPDYTYNSIAEVSDLKIIDVVEPEKYGFNLRIGILIKPKKY